MYFCLNTSLSRSGNSMRKQYPAPEELKQKWHLNRGARYLDWALQKSPPQTGEHDALYELGNISPSPLTEGHDSLSEFGNNFLLPRLRCAILSKFGNIPSCSSTEVHDTLSKLGNILFLVNGDHDTPSKYPRSTSPLSHTWLARPPP
jgi:hypothetical protein